VLAVAYLLPVVYLIWSLRNGPPAGPNPWDAKGLEWQTASPPPTHNFETIPVVDRPAYDYPLTRGAADE
jgi:cytochrome c oxidase subunit 1